MGYYSDVVIAVCEEREPEFQAILRQTGLITCADIFTDNLVQFIHIKWYPEYEDVIIMMNWLDSINEEEYGFVRNGEELGDTELQGEYWDYGIYISQQIEIE